MDRAADMAELRALHVVLAAQFATLGEEASRCRTQAAATRARSQRLRVGTLAVTLPSDVTCGHVARRGLDACYAHHSGAVLDGLKMVVSKLATDALHHGEGRIQLRVNERAEHFHIEMSRRRIINAPELEAQELQARVGALGPVAIRWGTREGGDHVWADVHHEGHARPPGEPEVSVR